MKRLFSLTEEEIDVWRHIVGTGMADKDYIAAVALPDSICVFCGKSVGGFRDKTSYNEWLISGMCQKCQDEIF
jgi:hypothetical protein